MTVRDALTQLIEELEKPCITRGDAIRRAGIVQLARTILGYPSRESMEGADHAE